MIKLIAFFFADFLNFLSKIPRLFQPADKCTLNIQVSNYAGREGIGAIIPEFPGVQGILMVTFYTQ